MPSSARGCLILPLLPLSAFFSAAFFVLHPSQLTARLRSAYNHTRLTLLDTKLPCGISARQGRAAFAAVPVPRLRSASRVLSCKQGMAHIRSTCTCSVHAMRCDESHYSSLIAAEAQPSERHQPRKRGASRWSRALMLFRPSGRPFAVMK